MLPLYFTSSLAHNKVFTEVEDIFPHIPRGQVFLTFDSNIVVYFRDFYLNPAYYSTSPNKANEFSAVKYLIEKMHQYELLPNAAVGLEESCRSRSDFKIDVSKRVQSKKALEKVLMMTPVLFEKHIKTGKELRQVRSTDELTLTKIPSIKQDSKFSGLIVISYLYVLKMYLLQLEVDKGSMTKKEAFNAFLEYTLDEISITAGTILNYALHYFGGVDLFKALLFAKSGSTAEERLHKLFNGAIDLAYPTVVNLEMDRLGIPPDVPLIPVLVTGDKRLAFLHSVCNTVAPPGINIPLSENFQYVHLTIFEDYKPQWTPTEMQGFRERLKQDGLKRAENNHTEKKPVDHLLPIVEELEQQVLATL